MENNNSENKIYCPYTNSYLKFEDTSSEHIIPLSLGGANGFEIQVDKEFNKKVGSQIDGKLAEEFFIKLKRIKYNVKGHSNKNPKLIAKNGFVDGKDDRVRIELERKGIGIWDNRESKKISSYSNIKFSVTTDWTNFKLSRLRFIAKAALSAGYFIYQNKFQELINHEELRLIMNFNGDINDPIIKEIKASADVQFSDNKDPILFVFSYITSIIGSCSCIGLIPLYDTIVFFVGILGSYIGMIEVSCDKSQLPNEGIYEWGTIACIQNNRPIISSWKRLYTRIGEHLKGLQKLKDNKS